MKKIHLLILASYFLIININAQRKVSSIGFNLSIGFPILIELENESNQITPNNNINYTIDSKIFLSAGFLYEREVWKNVNLFINPRISLFKSNQFAEGALFQSDQSDKCLLHDSCSSFRLQLNDLFFTLPLHFKVLPTKSKINFGLGLNNYLQILSYYEYTISESGMSKLYRKESGNNFSEFTSRYNLSAQATLGYKLLNNFEVSVFYEYFFKKHLLSAPRVYSKLTNIGLNFNYWL